MDAEEFIRNALKQMPSLQSYKFDLNDAVNRRIHSEEAIHSITPILDGNLDVLSNIYKFLMFPTWKDHAHIVPPETCRAMCLNRTLDQIIVGIQGKLIWYHVPSLEHVKTVSMGESTIRELAWRADTLIVWTEDHLSVWNNEQAVGEIELPYGTSYVSNLTRDFLIVARNTMLTQRRLETCDVIDISSTLPMAIKRIECSDEMIAAETYTRSIYVIAAGSSDLIHAFNPGKNDMFAWYNEDLCLVSPTQLEIWSNGIFKYHDIAFDKMENTYNVVMNDKVVVHIDLDMNLVSRGLDESKQSFREAFGHVCGMEMMSSVSNDYLIVARKDRVTVFKYRVP